MVKTKKSKKSGLPPGTLVHIGEERSDRVRITVIRYNEMEVHEQELAGPAELEAVSLEHAEEGVTWINIEGVHHLETIDRMGKCYGIHPLTLEDIVNTEQRPKIEEYPDYLFIVLKGSGFADPKDQPGMHQISLVL